MASLIQTLVTENPMLVEVARFKRRFMETGRGRAVSLTVLGVAALAYGSLLLVIARFAGDVDPVAIVYTQTVVFALLAPALMHGSIAGERDRRTWDLLLVAPITNAQIVVGKFVAAMTGLLFGFVAFFIPTLLSAVTYRAWTGHPGRTALEMAYSLVVIELVSLSFGILALAMALFISARSKRAFTALATSLAVLFLWLVVAPVVAGMLSFVQAVGLSLIGHPFFAIARMDEPLRSHDLDLMSGVPQSFFGLPQVGLYLLMAASLILWAQKSLTHADGGQRSHGDTTRA